jgi:hypothetical protein
MKMHYLYRGLRRPLWRTVVAAVFGVAVLGGLGVVSAAPQERASASVVPTTATAYGWPIKPFDQPHPVRGNFGDPRTVFHGPPTAYTLYHAAGSFTFHRGVDISAPVGTKVYPVRDGIVIFDSASHVNVASSNGTVFEYWHIGASLRLGTVVHAGRTVLGTIQPSLGHVDLTETQDGHATNPLAPGHLTPYRDTTRPTVTSIRLQSDRFGHVLFPNFVRGSVWLVAAAYDKPSLAVPGNWGGMPVTPALLTWRIQRPSGTVVVPTRVAVDFRTIRPDNGDFWSYYARGTFQNMAVFANHYSFMQPGKYLFLLSPTKFDTHSLQDGIYDLVVTATDIRGHSDTRSLRFTIHNRAGWVGS